MALYMKLNFCSWEQDKYQFGSQLGCNEQSARILPYNRIGINFHWDLSLNFTFLSFLDWFLISAEIWVGDVGIIWDKH